MYRKIKIGESDWVCNVGMARIEGMRLRINDRTKCFLFGTTLLFPCATNAKVGEPHNPKGELPFFNVEKGESLISQVLFRVMNEN